MRSNEPDHRAPVAIVAPRGPGVSLPRASHIHRHELSWSSFRAD